MILTAMVTRHKTQLFLFAGRLIFCGVCRFTGSQQVSQSWQGKRTHAHAVSWLFISIEKKDVSMLQYVPRFCIDGRSLLFLLMLAKVVSN